MCARASRVMYELRSTPSAKKNARLARSIRRAVVTGKLVSLKCSLWLSEREVWPTTTTTAVVSDENSFARPLARSFETVAKQTSRSRGDDLQMRLLNFRK